MADPQAFPQYGIYAKDYTEPAALVPNFLFWQDRTAKLWSENSATLNIKISHCVVLYLLPPGHSGGACAVGRSPWTQVWPGVPCLVEQKARAQMDGRWRYGAQSGDMARSLLVSPRFCRLPTILPSRLPTISPCFSPRKYTTLGPCYPATPLFARPPYRSR
jgi:hypothetical protein